MLSFKGVSTTFGGSTDTREDTVGTETTVMYNFENNNSNPRDAIIVTPYIDYDNANTWVLKNDYWVEIIPE